MATVYKIHPAIGIARVGNSPTEFFIGPERIGQFPDPPGGFKDSQCRVKRQAARFRIYAHLDDSSVEEITSAVADISWTVHLVNKKATRANTEPDADMTIDPGPRTLTGPNQQQLFDTGTISFSGIPVVVPLGEIRSDIQNHLVVLGGFGKSASPEGTGLVDYYDNPDWYDDVSDGPVTATITLLADSSTPPVAGAWAIVGPPKFAPHQDSVITLYDRLIQAMIPDFIAPASTTSYTKDVYPILQRARDTQWVENTAGHHTWPDPVIADADRNAIYSRIETAEMPALAPGPESPSSRLTLEQRAHMERWKDGDFTNDWTGIPAPQSTITPEGLDRAALEACVGGAFEPGMEVGAIGGGFLLLNDVNYTEVFRLNHALVDPGDITLTLAEPWQADFASCGEHWWPVAHPNFVIRGGVPGQSWPAAVGGVTLMVDKWNKLGFVVRQDSQHVEVARCDTASIGLLTPLLNFQDVPQGPMGMVHEVSLAIAFEVISPTSAVTLQYAVGGAPSHAQLVAATLSDTVGPTAVNSIATARLWVTYRTGAVGDVLPPQTLVVQDSGGTQSWEITVIGNTVGRKTAATAMVLDRSLSMADDRGDALSKHLSLQQAAGIFVDVMLEGDGVGIVRFNEDAQPLQSILQLGDGGPSDTNRADTKAIITGTGLDPSGATSIGDGIFEGRLLLSTAPLSYDVNSLVVLTDGNENRTRFIAEVAGEINEFTYAVGLGQPQNVSAAALQTISGNNGGYLLITGEIDTENQFLLQKHFLQILAGISNAQVVLDPQGDLIPGRVERVPFQLTAADKGVEVILLTPETKIVDFRLQTPNGAIIEPWLASSTPGMRFVLSQGVSYYRLTLPAELRDDRFDAGGTWHALLRIDKPRLQRSESKDGVDRNIALKAMVPHIAGKNQRIRTVPYSIVVHSYSSLELETHVEQSGFEPGAVITVVASLAQAGIPMAGNARPNPPSVWADVMRPHGSTTLALTANDDGQFEGRLTATVPGIYRFRIRAGGITAIGEPFTREKTLTAAVWRGGNTPRTDDVDFTREQLCKLLNCMLQPDGVIGKKLEKKLHAEGVDIDQLRKCLQTFCRGS